LKPRREAAREKEDPMILDWIETTPYTTNCYLIGDEETKACALVDPGGSLEKLLDMVERHGLKLEKILLTHGHYDHVREVGALVDAAPAPGLAVYLHPADVREDDKRLYPPLPCGFNWFEDGEHLSVGNIDVRVLHTPGHTAGSVTLLAEDVMLCGDTLFAGSCGRQDLTGGDGEALLASLAKLGRLEGDLKVCPGHGPMTTLERERQTNPYLRQAMGL